MKCHCLFIVFAIGAILIKENSCVPAIHPFSQRGIIFPVDNWDDCFLDETSKRPGSCKKLEECPEVLKKWDTENVYPKTCYFIKKQQFVCCPLTTTTKEIFTSTEKFDFLNKNTTTQTVTEKLGNIFLDAVTKKPETTKPPTTPKRPSNIFLDGVVKNITTTTTTSTKRPSNIFLDNLNTTTTTRKPTFSIPDIFNTEKPFNTKRRSEIECDLQNPYKSEIDDRNGRQSTETQKFPFMTVLGWQSRIDGKIWYPCGGVLIASRFVLTAAHCAEIGGESPTFVYLGEENLADSQEDTIKIKQFFVHPGYNMTTIYNDIALVELEREVGNPVACLWTQHSLPIAKLTALGYGQSRFDASGSNQLLKASLSAIDKSDCQEYYKLDAKVKTMDIVDSHLCAGDIENVHDTCQADTGGPLLVEFNNIWYVVGISSFGLGCADLPPSIYTRVSSFIDWIETIVWPNFDVRFDRK